MGTAERFVTDTMLGKLARWLRAMGYDTLYFKVADDRHLLQLCRQESRLLLTRDARLALLAGREGLLVQSTEAEPQVVEVVERLGLAPAEADFLSRCLECNGLIEDRPRESVRAAVPPFVFATQERFWGCPDCGRIYWQGSHAERILARLGRILDSPADSVRRGDVRPPTPEG